ALKALGIGAGDEVITQVNTFYATVGAIVAVGARPVFVDVDDQFAIDHTKLDAAITPRTKAVLPVWWTGLPPDLPAILDIARRRGLRVVEDACPATGGAFDGRPAGSWGDTAGFSMHPLKPLHVWGDGGPVTTSDDRAGESLHLQPAAKDLGYARGDFPVAEAQAEDIVTLPGHQYLTNSEVDYMIDRVRRFYGR